MSDARNSASAIVRLKRKRDDDPRPDAIGMLSCFLFNSYICESSKVCFVSYFSVFQKARKAKYKREIHLLTGHAFCTDWFRSLLGAVVEQKPAPASKRKSIEHALEGLSLSGSNRRKFKRVSHNSSVGSVDASSVSKAARKQTHWPAEPSVAHNDGNWEQNEAADAHFEANTDKEGKQLVHVGARDGAIELAWRSGEQAANGISDASDEVYDVYVEDNDTSEESAAVHGDEAAVTLPAMIEELLVPEQQQAHNMDEHTRDETSDENAEDYEHNDYPEEGSTSATEGEDGVVDAMDELSTEEAQHDKHDFLEDIDNELVVHVAHDQQSSDDDDSF